jgi:hypothetical protein
MLCESVGNTARASGWGGSIGAGQAGDACRRCGREESVGDDG